MKKATHQGELKIGDIVISCAVLEDGQRVLTQMEVLQALGRSKKASGKKGDLVGSEHLPPFLRANNLKPFIDNILTVPTEPIVFKPLHGGRSACGYKAELLPEICSIFIDADAALVLRPNQKHLAERARLLLRGFATIGITALVDEATGYQDVRKKDALAKLLEKWIEKEIYRKWTKTFPIEFYEQIFRLKGWDMLNPKRQRPGVVSKYTDNFIYKRIAPELLDVLREKNPTTRRGVRAVRHHQWLTGDVGVPKLRAHLEAVIALMKISKNWKEFERHIDRVYPRYDKTPDLPFADD
jgi:hypothetical protein